MEPSSQQNDPKILAAVLALGLDEPASQPGTAVNEYSRLPAETEPTAGSEPFPAIADYRIVGRLGEGGMGIVWRAEQLSTRREVALKLMTAGHFASNRARQRFEREIELAARLEHPHIARVYDSGSCAGLYYYAMELVEGTHLDRYARDQELTPRQILVLMRDVCHAVHYAHQRGVIHRDLKPSNVLVTRDGQPHVLDFGLAKALEEEPGSPMLTQEGQYAGTPAFMAPEQAAGRFDAIDTRADVYGLGATLYLLLNGQTPHDCDGPRFDVLRRVATEEVRRPRQLNSSLPVEVEWLLLKALSRDPQQRYGSAGELAEEIDRYLRSEPLKASPPSAVYRIRKFVRRNKGPVVAGAAVLAALVVGLTLATAFYIRAERQRQDAETQATIAQAVSQFLSDMLSSADPRNSLGDSLTVLQAIETAIRELDAGRLRDQPQVEAAVRATIGNSLIALGRFDDAEPNLRKSLELSRGAGNARNPQLASSLHCLAYVHQTRGKTGHAEPLAREALEIRRETLGPHHPRTTQSVILLALVLQAKGKSAEGETMLRDTLGSLRKTLPPRHPDLTDTLSTLAGLLHAQGKLAEAEPLFREALEVRRASLPPTHPDLAQSLTNLAGLLLAQGRLADAEPLFSEALNIYRKALPALHPDIAGCAKSFALVLRDQGKLSAAEPLLREALEIYRKTLPPEHPEIATCLSSLASVLLSQGKLADAEPLAREAVAINRKSLPPGHWARGQSLNYLATLLLSLKKPVEAEAVAREALEINRHGVPGEDLNDAWSLNNLAEALKAQNKLDEAAALHREALEVHRRILPPGHLKLVDALIYLANTLVAQGELAEVEPLYREALEIETKAHGVTGGRTSWLASLLATALEKINRHEDADAIRR